jgi:predicted CoA-binding protein
VIRYLDDPPAPGPVPILDAAGAMDLLAGAARIAIVGASASPWRPSNSVMGYLLAHGYECVPVNPTVDRVLDRTAYPTLEAAVDATGSPFDIVDVFRRPEATPDVARSAVATRCRALWLQLRIVSWEAARIAHAGGLAVVMDRCTQIDHRSLRLRSAASRPPDSADGVIRPGDDGARPGS